MDVQLLFNVQYAFNQNPPNYIIIIITIYYYLRFPFDQIEYVHFMNLR